MKSITFIVAALAVFFSTAEASAKHRRQHIPSHEASSQCGSFMPCEGVGYSKNAKRFIGIPFGAPIQTYTPARPHVVHETGISIGGRPRAWCGWYMRGRKGVSDPRYNLAANWAHYGHAVGPQPGAVVVWRHHVGELVSQVSGNVWLVHSGNDGHAVRTRARSIAGAIAFRA